MSEQPLVSHLNAVTPFVAGDGCVLRELLHPARHPVTLGYSISHAYVEVGGRTLDHWLAQSEVYYVLAGRGTMFLDNVPHTVETGSYYYIPPFVHQWLRNDGESRFEFLCIVDPPWTTDGETVVARDQ